MSTASPQREYHPASMSMGSHGRQRTFFAEFDRQRLVEPCDPNAAPSDVPRLTGQNAAILFRLQQGPVTNYELAAISLKYTSRISDLRRAGYVVTCDRGQAGLNTYRLDGRL